MAMWIAYPSGGVGSSQRVASWHSFGQRRSFPRVFFYRISSVMAQSTLGQRNELNELRLRCQALSGWSRRNGRKGVLDVRFKLQLIVSLSCSLPWITMSDRQGIFIDVGCFSVEMEASWLAHLGGSLFQIGCTSLLLRSFFSVWKQWRKLYKADIHTRRSMFTVKLYNKWACFHPIPCLARMDIYNWHIIPVHSTLEFI